MKSLDQLIIVEGFEKTGGRERLVRLAESIQEACPVRRFDIVSGCPRESGSLHPRELGDYLEHTVDEILSEGKNRAIIGVSFGALLTLDLLAVRRKIKDFERAFLLDGPLNPYFEVRPPESGIFEQFHVQYEHRVDFATECLQALQRLSFEDRQKIINMGNLEEESSPIVPTRAKYLPGIPFMTLSECSGHSLTPEKIREFTRNAVFILSRDQQEAVA